MGCRLTAISTTHKVLVCGSRARRIVATWGSRQLKTMFLLDSKQRASSDTIERIQLEINLSPTVDGTADYPNDLGMRSITPRRM